MFVAGVLNHPVYLIYWAPTKNQINRIQTGEMRFLRQVKGCTILDKIKNDNIRHEVKVEPLYNKVGDYRQKWTDHTNRMSPERYPLLVRDYTARGRDVGRPRKRWADAL